MARSQAGHQTSIEELNFYDTHIYRWGGAKNDTVQMNSKLPL